MLEWSTIHPPELLATADHFWLLPGSSAEEFVPRQMKKHCSLSGSGGAEQRGRGGGTRRGTGERLGRLCWLPLPISNYPSKRGPRSALPSHRDSPRPSCEFALPARAACAQAPARPARVPGGGRGPSAGAPSLYPSLSCAACCCAGRKGCAAGPCRPPRENHVVCATSEKNESVCSPR